MGDVALKSHGMHVIPEKATERSMISSSSTQLSGAQLQAKKRILKFRLFKSLKGTSSITSQFTVGKTLGKGSFGEVRLCLNKATNVRCAMKIVNKAVIGKHQVLVDLMEQELEVLQNTEHPHIVRAMELLEDEVNFYIISELVTGGELYAHVVKVKRMGERQTASVIKQLLLAVNYMHQLNIVHRDIKPENILIVPEEATTSDFPNVKLTDFGFACFFQKEKGLTQVLGSPLYMAPEIVKEETYGLKVDVWSLGVIAHILLSGAPPFYGKSTLDIYQSIVADEPQFGRFKDNLTPEAIEFTRQMLEKDPARRPSAAELLQHPWLRDNAAEAAVSVNVAEEILADLTAFQK